MCVKRLKCTYGHIHTVVVFLDLGFSFGKGRFTALWASTVVVVGQLCLATRMMYTPAP